MVRKTKAPMGVAEMLRDAAQRSLVTAGQRIDRAVPLFLNELGFTPVQLALAGTEIKMRARRYLKQSSAAMGMKVDVKAHKRQKPGLPPSLVASATERTLGILHTFKINGQPIATVTVREARAWAQSQHRNAAWVFSITEDLDDDVVVGDQVDETWAQRKYDALTSRRDAARGGHEARPN